MARHDVMSAGASSSGGVKCRLWVAFFHLQDQDDRSSRILANELTRKEGASRTG